MGRVIDSSVFIELERRGHPLDIHTLAPGGQPIGIAAISVSELLVSVHRAQPVQRGHQRELFIDGLLQQIPVLPFTLEIARVHARLLATMLGHGERIGASDLEIAATALSFDYNVLTHNVRDFSRVPGLVVRHPNL